ncbi:MAG: hypothetical protein JSU00_12315 [Acidobacteria bacterium]|nr:hypothetical protein [Acidobacteriota bacterium]
MKNTLLAMVFGFTLCGGAAFAEEWTGYISDAKCGKAHTDGSEKSVKCVTGCVKGGTAPVLVSGDQVLKIDEASKAKVMDHLGHKVTVNGSLRGDTVTISSVKAAS